MNLTIKILVILAFTIALFAFIGCEKKTETPEVKEETTQEEPAKIEETPEEVNEPEVPVVQIPDLTGQWTGKFDARNTVLNITEQTDSTFKGKITISYREVINQEVEGTISPSTMRMTMKDLLHSRFRGRYSGKLSEDGKNYSGTFTMDLDKSQFSFNLTKK
jgi:predicted membrane protein